MDLSNLKQETYLLLDILSNRLVEKGQMDYDQVIDIYNGDAISAKNAIVILEDLGLAKAIWLNGGEFAAIIKNDSLPIYLEGGSFTDRFLTPKIAIELIDRFKSNIPFSELLKVTKSNFNLVEKVRGYIETQGFILKEFEKEEPSFIKITNNKNTNVSVDAAKEEAPSLSFEKSYVIEPNPFQVIDGRISPCFNIEKIASVFAEHISCLGQEESGQMVGIFGRWGRGKTYFVEKVCKQLNIDFNQELGTEDFEFIRFQAWKYQDTPAIWAYLYESLSSKYFGKNMFCAFCRKIWLNLNRNLWELLKDIILNGILWCCIVLIINKFNISGQGFIKSLIDLFKDHNVFVIGGGALSPFLYKILKKEGYKAFDLLKKYSKGVSFSNHLGVQAEVEKELVNLLKVWFPKSNFLRGLRKLFRIDRSKRLLLFIDDVDRCSEDRIIPLVDALRVMLEQPEIIKRVIVLLAIDESKLKMAIRKKYKELDDALVEYDLKVIEEEYLDKLFISGIKLAPLNTEQIDEYIEKVVKEIEIEVDSPYISSTEIDDVEENNTSQFTENDDQKVSSITFNQAVISNELRIVMLKRKIKTFDKEMTPRKIRIFIVRYLLAEQLYRCLSPKSKFGVSFDSELITLTEKDISNLLDCIHKRMTDSNPEIEGSESNLFIEQIADMVVTY